jgi:hypothetical protein
LDIHEARFDLIRFDLITSGQAPHLRSARKYFVRQPVNNRVYGPNNRFAWSQSYEGFMNMAHPVFQEFPQFGPFSSHKKLGLFQKHKTELAQLLHSYPI